MWGWEKWLPYTPILDIKYYVSHSVPMRCANISISSVHIPDKPTTHTFRTVGAVPDCTVALAMGTIAPLAFTLLFWAGFSEAGGGGGFPLSKGVARAIFCGCVRGTVCTLKIWCARGLVWSIVLVLTGQSKRAPVTPTTPCVWLSTPCDLDGGCVAPLGSYLLRR